MPTALILGATSDIGFAIASKFASHKYDIQLAARNAPGLATFQKDIEIRHSVSCTVHAFDALKFGEHLPFWQSLAPRPDVVVYVIGYMKDNETARANWDEAAQTINANYTGAVSILNIAAAAYESGRSGTIVGISSVAGDRGRGSNFIYGSAKAAFTAYLSGLRNKLFPSGVHVMTVLPGFVNTKMTENLNLPKLLTAQPAEVADAVYAGVQKKKNIIYVKWFWRWIMLIITSVPEAIFKTKKL